MKKSVDCAEIVSAGRKVLCFEPVVSDGGRAYNNGVREALRAVVATLFPLAADADERRVWVDRINEDFPA